MCVPILYHVTKVNQNEKLPKNIFILWVVLLGRFHCESFALILSVSDPYILWFLQYIY